MEKVVIFFFENVFVIYLIQICTLTSELHDLFKGLPPPARKRTLIWNLKFAVHRPC